MLESNYTEPEDPQLTQLDLDYLELTGFLKDNGYYYDDVAKFKGGDYTILVYRNYPMSERFRQIFQAPTIKELYYAIQSRIESGRVPAQPGTQGNP